MADPSLSFEALLDRFVRASTAEFSLNEACKAVESVCGTMKKAAIERHIRTALEEDGSVFTHDPKARVFQTRHVFFNGKSFCIRRSDVECKHHVLIPGGRFAPFCHKKVFPSEMTLKTADGTLLMPKCMRLSIADAAAFYNLLGAEEMFHVFEADDPRNTPILSKGDPNGMIYLQFYDLTPLGDARNWRMTVRDWTEGVFEVAPLPEMNVPSLPCSYFAPLEKALCAVFETFESYIDIPEQLAQAFYRAPEIFDGIDLLDVEHFIAKSDLIVIILTGTNTLLWRNDEDPPVSDAVDASHETQENESEADDASSPLRLSSGPCDSMEAIFRAGHSPVSSVEVAAELLNELFIGGETFENIYDRLIEAYAPENLDEIQRVTLKNEIELLWEKLFEDYNHTLDHHQGRVRQYALKVNRRRLTFLKQLGHEKADTLTPGKEAILEEYAQAGNLLLRLLQSMNDSYIVSSAQEADRLLDAVDKFGSLLEHLAHAYAHAEHASCSCGHDHAHEGECSCGHHHGDCGHDHAHGEHCSCSHHHEKQEDACGDDETDG